MTITQDATFPTTLTSVVDQETMRRPSATLNLSSFGEESYESVAVNADLCLGVQLLDS
jgi:hypothetical protein